MSAGIAQPVLTGEGTWRLPRVKDGATSFQRLPFAPLEREVDRLGGYYKIVSKRVDGLKRERLERAWERGKTTGFVTWRAADQFAVELLAVHPYEVWGIDWFDLHE